MSWGSFSSTKSASAPMASFSCSSAPSRTSDLSTYTSGGGISPSRACLACASRGRGVCHAGLNEQGVVSRPYSALAIREKKSAPGGCRWLPQWTRNESLLRLGARSRIHGKRDSARRWAALLVLVLNNRLERLSRRARNRGEAAARSRRGLALCCQPGSMAAPHRDLYLLRAVAVMTSSSRISAPSFVNLSHWATT